VKKVRKRKAPLLKRAHRGQKGITLIEVLIVIAILGVIAGVVIYAVGPFRGAGTLQSANTEQASVKTAVQAYISFGGNSTTGTMGSGRTCTNFTPNTDNRTPIDYFDGTLRAIYTIDTSQGCSITAANADFSGGWGSSITWSTLDCEWKSV
jgi:prepilin-type N-terminal cleavage/methylation domain-containing protein